VGRLRVLIAKAVVQHQPVVDAPVILCIEAVVGVDLLEVANRLGPAGVRHTKQERRERVSAAIGQRRRAGHPGFEKAESGPAADVLLAEAIGLLPVEREPRLDRVRPFDERQVVLDGEARLFGAVVRGASPGRELGKRNDAEVLVAVDG
jgi:hypothetical protein